MRRAKGGGEFAFPVLRRRWAKRSWLFALCGEDCAELFGPLHGNRVGLRKSALWKDVGANSASLAVF